MNYAEGNAFKAIWRRCAARMGLSKRGYEDGLYDAEKVVFFGERMVAQEKLDRAAQADAELNEYAASLKAPTQDAEEIPSYAGMPAPQVFIRRCIGCGCSANEVHADDCPVLRHLQENAPAPLPDMSDWRNWQVGDLVECVEASGTILAGGDVLGLTYVDADRGYVDVDPTTNGPVRYKASRFRWHSRPAR
ncbi:hypothetical protein D3C85_758190 [compost metagenome]